jgi:hypothetical protein
MRIIRIREPGPCATGILQHVNGLSLVLDSDASLSSQDASNEPRSVPNTASFRDESYRHN